MALFVLIPGAGTDPQVPMLPRPGELARRLVDLWIGSSPGDVAGERPESP